MAHFFPIIAENIQLLEGAQRQLYVALLSCSSSAPFFRANEVCAIYPSALFNYLLLFPSTCDKPSPFKSEDDTIINITTRYIQLVSSITVGPSVVATSTVVQNPADHYPNQTILPNPSAIQDHSSIVSSHIVHSQIVYPSNIQQKQDIVPLNDFQKTADPPPQLPPNPTPAPLPPVMPHHQIDVKLYLESLQFQVRLWHMSSIQVLPLYLLKCWKHF